MRRTPIYILNVITIKFLKSDVYPAYSRKKTAYFVDREALTTIHLSFKEAELQKDELIKNCQEYNMHVFSAMIDEFEDGSIISIETPRQRWLYDRHGEMVDLLHNTHCNFTSSSEIPPYERGDIVEILSEGFMLYLGIIVKTPRDLSKKSDGYRVLDDRYSVLTGPYIEDDNCFCTSQLRRYEGNMDDVRFMKKILSRYPKLLPHVD